MRWKPQCQERIGDQKPKGKEKSGSSYEQIADKENVIPRTTYGSNCKPEYWDYLNGRSHYEKNRAIS